MVADLINADNKWRVDKLEQHFMKENIDAIIQIPLPRSREEDAVLWHFDKRKEYTVKSGYQIALNLKFPNAPTNSENGYRHWKFLWMLDLPKKIKIFMWSVMKNILPTAKHLWKGKSLQDPICQRCKKEVETIKHVLVECKAARKVCELAPLPLQSHIE